MVRGTSAMLTKCTKPGCATLTLGIGLCAVHDLARRPVFVRGRPFAAPAGVVPDEPYYRAEPGRRRVSLTHG